MAYLLTDKEAQSFDEHLAPSCTPSSSVQLQRSKMFSLAQYWRFMNIRSIFIALLGKDLRNLWSIFFIFIFFNPFQQDVSRPEPGSYPLQLVRQSTRNFFGLGVWRGPCLCCTGTQPGGTALFLSATWIRAKEEQTVTMSCSNLLPSSINCQPWFYV